MPVAIELDNSPAKLLSQFRGTIVAVRDAFPSVLHVDVRDGDGGIWRLATQDATWSPAETEPLIGLSILSAEIDRDGSLSCALSRGATFVVVPEPASHDDPPNWELIAPSGVVLEFGPGLRWQIEEAG